MNIFFKVAVLAVTGICVHANATEPAWCNPTQFNKLEISYNGAKPSNLHVYQIGKVRIAGMAIGESNAQDVRDLALSANPNVAGAKYCTWYFNDGNTDAEKLFTWIVLPKPSGSDYAGTSSTYMNLIGNQFDQSAVNFVRCAVDYGYIGLGCNGQRHRGPSVFAMLLTYSGCTPEHSTQIANQIWGENGIKPEMRQALARAAGQLAASHPELVQKLQTVLAR